MHDRGIAFFSFSTSTCTGTVDLNSSICLVLLCSLNDTEKLVIEKKVCLEEIAVIGLKSYLEEMSVGSQEHIMTAFIEQKVSLGGYCSRLAELLPRGNEYWLTKNIMTACIGIGCCII